MQGRVVSLSRIRKHFAGMRGQPARGKAETREVKEVASHMRSLPFIAKAQRIPSLLYCP